MQEKFLTLQRAVQAAFQRYAGVDAFGQILGKELEIIAPQLLGAVHRGVGILQ